MDEVRSCQCDRSYNFFDSRMIRRDGYGSGELETCITIGEDWLFISFKKLVVAKVVLGLTPILFGDPSSDRSFSTGCVKFDRGFFQ